MNRLKKILKICGYAIGTLLVLFCLARFCLFEFINVINPRVILGEIASPQKTYIFRFLPDDEQFHDFVGFPTAGS